MKRSIWFVVLALILGVVPACASSTEDEDDDSSTNDEITASTEEEFKAQCRLPFQAACYHEVLGVRYSTMNKCMKGGAGYLPNMTAVGWYKCLPEQPSGWYTLYIWSWRCPRGKSFNWCAKNHQI